MTEDVKPSPPKGLLIAGIVLLVLSVAGCGVGCASASSLFGELTKYIDGSRMQPLGTSTTLTATGDVAVVVVEGQSSGVQCVANDDAGRSVVMDDPGLGTSGTVEVNNDTYEFIYTFETVAGARYEVVCDDEFGSDLNYGVFDGPDVTKIGLMAGGFLGGFVLFVIGIILLIVGLVQRSKWKKNNSGGFTPNVPPPAGGYTPPPPGGAAGGYTPPAPPQSPGTPPAPPQLPGTPPPPAPGSGTPPPPPGPGAPPPPSGPIQ